MEGGREGGRERGGGGGREGKVTCTLLFEDTYFSYFKVQNNDLATTKNATTAQEY